MLLSVREYLWRLCAGGKLVQAVRNALTWRLTMADASGGFGKWFEGVQAKAGDGHASSGDVQEGGSGGGGMFSFLGTGSAAAADEKKSGRDVESGGLLANMSDRVLGRSTQPDNSVATYCGCTLTRTQRLQACIVLLAAGAGLMFLALFLFLPFVRVPCQQYAESRIAS